MPDQEVINRCERCDEETPHLIKFIAPDNSERYVCWSCLAREEKNFNLKQSWKREGRARR